MLPLFLFQDPTSTTEGLEVVEKAQFSLIDIILSSGVMGIAIFIVLLILSFIALYIYVERFLTIRKAGEVDENFMNNIRASVQSGNIMAARSLCAKTDSPVARMVEKGLQRIGKPLEDIGVAVENVGNLEVYKLEKNLATLATISGAAPMIGFLGTVTGMILAFFNIANAPGGGAPDPALLAGGIYQALMTTAFGLVVGILAYIGYNFLTSQVQKVVFKMEATSVEFLDLLQEPA